MDNHQTQKPLEIPLSRLLPWPENVRGPQPKGKVGEMSMGELVSSIRSVGLLQNLVVQKATGGKWFVVAGGRRLTALGILAEEGTIKKNEKVLCRTADEEDPLEIGLAENVIREPMHPAAQFAAFKGLHDSGRSVAEIAARFGVAESVVWKRLALARVSPKLLAEYRGGKMDLEQLQAFTVCDDHKQQERVWKDLPTFNQSASYIRRVLSLQTIVATDKRVRFVTVEAYEKAGGLVKRDLFSEGDEEGVFLLDEVLLNSLVTQKLEALAVDLRAEGWSWVEVHAVWDLTTHTMFTRVPPKPVPLPARTAARLLRLQTALAAVYEQYDDSDPAEAKRLSKLERDIDAIEASRRAVYEPEVIEACGAIATITDEGEPLAQRGLLLKKDEKKLSSPSLAGGNAAPPSPYSFSLIEELTTSKTALIAAALGSNASVALASIVHSMLLSEFQIELEVYRGGVSSLQISITHPRLTPAEGSTAVLALDQARAAVASQLPKQASALWPWCLKQSQESLLSLLAFCVSRTLNGIITKRDGADRASHANELASALKVDVAQWFTPTAANFFNRVSRAVILECLTAAGKPASPETLKLKKGDLAAFAEKEVVGTGWLPDPMLLVSPEEEA